MGDLFLDFLNVSISASYLIFAVILLRLIFKKIPRKFFCILWGIVGLRLVSLFSFESIFSLIPSAQTIKPTSGAAYGVEINSGISAIDNPVNEYLAQREMYSISAAPDFSEVLSRVGAVAWFVGIAAIIIYGIASYIRVKMTVTGAVLLENNVYQCETVESPFILGFIKPKIYIPFNMDESTRSYVIAHENAHLKRRDHWIKPIGFAVLALHWFNPLVWVAYVLLCKDIEVACDERVVSEMNGEDRREYASALLDCAVNRRKIAACPLAFGEVGIKERIKGIVNYKKPAFWVIIIAIIACMVASVCFLTNPGDGKKEEFVDLGYRFSVTVEDGEKTETESYIISSDSEGIIADGIGFELTVIDLQMGAVSAVFSKPVLYNDEEAESIVVDLGGSENIILPESNKRVTLSFTQVQSLEQAISEAILERNKDRYMKGIYACESHQILQIGSSDIFNTDGTSKKGSVTVYLMAAYCEYVCFGGEPENVGGGSNPVVITFDYDGESGLYTLAEYQDVTKGGEEKLPKDVRNAIKGKGIELEDLWQNCNNKANTYFSGAADKTFASCELTTVSAVVTEFETEGDNPRITFEIFNYGDKDIVYGWNDAIYKYDNGSWREVEMLQPYIRNMPYQAGFYDIDELRVKSGESTVITCQLNRFDISEDGYYRFETGIREENKPFVITVDFTVGDFRLYPEISSEEMTTVAVTDEKETTKTNALAVYTFENSTDIMKPQITLKNDNEYHFFESVYSSYMNVGTYEFSDGKLILKTDDGKYHYTFDVDGDKLVFEAENSTEIIKYKPAANAEPVSPVPNGAVFIKS